MSEQIKAKIEEMTTNKSRLEAVLLSMFEGVMVVDIKSKIILMNKTLKDILMLEDNIIGKKVIEVIRNIEIQDATEKALDLKKGVISQEISLMLKEKKVLLIHAVPVFRQGATEGAVIVFHDITDLRHLENIRKDFVANVSHELRTPISSIKGYAETLLNGALDDKENAKEFVEIMLTDSNRLAALINDLLDLASIESEKLVLNFKPIKVSSLLPSIVKGLKTQLNNKSIKLSIEIPEDAPEILADEEKISQIMLNLIDNAIKYNNVNGSIVVMVSFDDKNVKISIADTGIGIPSEDVPRIFERFYRVDKSRSRELESTGLGLSIVKHLVQVHSGEVSVKSVVGQGSTFSFTLPIIS